MITMAPNILVWSQMAPQPMRAAATAGEASDSAVQEDDAFDRIIDELEQNPDFLMRVAERVHRLVSESDGE